MPNETMNMRVTSYLEEVLDVSIKEQLLKLRLTLSIAWDEPRLIIGNATDEDETVDVEADHALSRLWTPKLYIHNLVEYRPLSVLEPLNYFKVLGSTIQVN